MKSEKAVIDRIEEGFAVLILEASEDKLIIPDSRLPADAREGQWLQISFSEGGEGQEIESVEFDPAKTEEVRQRIEDKLSRLRGNQHRDDE
jgi:hypothetical protein